MFFAGAVTVVVSGTAQDRLGVLTSNGLTGTQPMADDNATGFSATETVARFDDYEGAPDIADIVYGLHLVCEALNEAPVGGKHGGVANNVAYLARAAYLMTRQLNDRFICSKSRPVKPKKRPKLVAARPLPRTA
jgi:hypothetical protein